MTEDIVPNRTRFEEITRTYYRAWFRFHPEAAVEVGVPGYAHLLTPYAEDERGALVCLNDELVVSLDELARYGLSPDEQLDLEILHNAARLENEYLLDVEPRRADPGRFLPINAVYQLLIRPVEDFSANLLARLTAVPAHLHGARASLATAVTTIPPLWLETTVTGARAATAFMRDLPRHPKVAGAGASSAIERASRDAVNALGEYADFLEREIAPLARGEFACGRLHFEHLLRRRHFLDADADEVRALGVRIFDATRAQLLQACRELGGGDDVAATSRRARAEYPPGAQLLDVYREQMRAAHAFLCGRDLVSVPGATRLDVVETPVFLRHLIPFAAYSEPSANDPAQQGYYYVTPPADDEQLAEHSLAAIMHTCVHEAWPGHHLQFVTANRTPAARTLPRLLNPSATLYEGWALYSEQLMQEQGFLARPESRFLLLKDRLWRALRILIDVDIHTRGLGMDAAADLMVQHLGFARSQALADVAWYTRSPTVPMSYATGWSIITALRDRLRQSRTDFNLKQFHDQLLSHGSVALPRVVRRAFGDSMWSAVNRDIYQGVGNETA